MCSSVVKVEVAFAKAARRRGLRKIVKERRWSIDRE